MKLRLLEATAKTWEMFPAQTDLAAREIETAVRDGAAWIDVIDRGPGVPADDVERLKRPFTRATEARSRADGAAGAGPCESSERARGVL